MRGKDEQQLDVFSYVSPEQRVPQDHPLRPLRVMTDEALRELHPRRSSSNWAVEFVKKRARWTRRCSLRSLLAGRSTARKSPLPECIATSATAKRTTYLSRRMA